MLNKEAKNKLEKWIAARNIRVVESAGNVSMITLYEAAARIYQLGNEKEKLNAKARAVSVEGISYSSKEYISLLELKETYYLAADVAADNIRAMLRAIAESADLFIRSYIHLGIDQRKGFESIAESLGAIFFAANPNKTETMEDWQGKKRVYKPGSISCYVSHGWNNAPEYITFKYSHEEQETRLHDGYIRQKPQRYETAARLVSFAQAKKCLKARKEAEKALTKVREKYAKTLKESGFDARDYSSIKTVSVCASKALSEKLEIR